MDDSSNHWETDHISDWEDSSELCEDDSDIEKKLIQPEKITTPLIPTQVLRDWSQIRPPMFYGFHNYYKTSTFESEICCSDSKHWKQAIEKEFDSIDSHYVWEDYQDRPPNPLDTTWVFKIKDNTHGNPLKFKWQLCVQGFNQIHGTDYKET